MAYSVTTDPTAPTLEELLSRKVVGQAKAVAQIIPCIQTYQAGLSPSGRPAGVFLLLGTTGTGKTRTVEALAEILHGSSRKVVRIDCGEFQMDHDSAKLIGSPPGYIGHRETRPVLTPERLEEVTSDKCALSIVLFDEIEKAAPTVAQLLLGILDNGILRLGDNTEVEFENSLIFFTSNLGAREMTREMQPLMGFRPSGLNVAEITERLESVAHAAVRKMYSPEFVNRIDAVITYQPLDDKALSEILGLQLQELQNHVNTRLGKGFFDIEVTAESRNFLLERGTSKEYGARELKRTIYRYVTQPVATMVLQGKIEAGTSVKVTVADNHESLRFQVEAGSKRTVARPAMLVVDDNQDFLHLLSLQLDRGSGFRLITAISAADAQKAMADQEIELALLDLLLPDGNGIKLAHQMKVIKPNLQIIIMTGGALTLEDDQSRRDGGFKLLEKPFLAEDIIKLISRKREAAWG